MNDLTILHLSDLHFNNKGAQPFKLYSALLYDIKEQLRGLKNVVIVVTGDIVNQGDYSCEKSIINFFQELKNIINYLKIEFHGIFFVPGNHDKVRSYATNILSHVKNLYDEQYFNEFGDFFKKSFEKYNALVKQICEIFDSGFNGFNESTFCCKYIVVGDKKELDNSGDKQSYIFVGFNTAWSATGPYDRRNLKLGKFQIDKIEEEYRNIRSEIGYNDKKPLVIAMAHHPLNWLTGSDEDIIQNFLIGQRGIDAQIFLCGHTHTRDVINWSNNRQSLTTLSTGIGWPEDSTTDHSDLHAYSIYVLHLDLNAIDVYVRSTNDGGKFVEDYRLYTQEENRKHKKIVLPLSSTNVHSYYELGTVSLHSPVVSFLSNEFIKSTEKFIRSLGKFRQRAIQQIHIVKNRLIAVKQKYTEESAKAGFKEGINSEEIAYDMFRSYIQILCDGFVFDFLGDRDSSQESDIRFHFRCLNIDSNDGVLYSQLCSSFWKRLEGKIPNPVKVLGFVELIKAAFEEKRPLIYSVNSSVCTTKTEWEDFITAVPNIEQNIYEYELCNSMKKRYPIITFGVSVRNVIDRQLLFCLDYYRIDDILGSILELYCKENNFNLIDLCKKHDFN